MQHHIVFVFSLAGWSLDVAFATVAFSGSWSRQQQSFLTRGASSTNLSVESYLDGGIHDVHSASASKPNTFTDLERIVVAQFDKSMGYAAQFSGIINRTRNRGGIVALPDASELRAGISIVPFGADPFILTGSSMAIWILLACLIGYYYASDKDTIATYILVESEPDKSLLGTGDWAFSLFKVFEQPKLFLFSCCCPAIRWADTVQMAGLLGFSSAFALFVGLQLAESLGVGWLLFVGVTTFFRQKIRAEFQLRHGDFTTILGDACTYMWCSPCAITQEARQLELEAQLAKTQQDQTWFSRRWF